MQSKKDGNNHESWRVQLETLLRSHTDEAEHFKEDGYSDVPFWDVSEDRPLGLPLDFWKEITKSRSLDCGRLFKSERGGNSNFSMQSSMKTSYISHSVRAEKMQIFRRDWLVIHESIRLIFFLVYVEVEEQMIPIKRVAVNLETDELIAVFRLVACFDEIQCNFLIRCEEYETCSFRFTPIWVFAALWDKPVFHDAFHALSERRVIVFHPVSSINLMYLFAQGAEL